MESIRSKCLEAVQVLENAVQTLHQFRLDGDLKIRWRRRCDQILNLLKEISRDFDNQLTIQQKQSLLHYYVRVECCKVLIDSLAVHGGEISDVDSSERVKWIEINAAFENRLKTINIVNLVHIDISSFLTDVSDLFSRNIKDIIENTNSSLKINSVLLAKYKKTSIKDNNELEEIIENKSFNTKNVEIYRTTALDEWFISNIREPLLKDVEEFQEKDSGWSLHSIVNIQLNINKFNPMHSGSSYLPLPGYFVKKEACINVKNDDNECFKWAILSALHPVPNMLRPQRLHHYKKFHNELNMDGINYPVSLKQIAKFEGQNLGISVNIFGIDDMTILPLHVTKTKRINHVNLLLIQSDKDVNHKHYVWIKSLSRLVGSTLSRCHNKKYLCDRCLHYFNSQEKLDAHEVQCSLLNDTCLLELPAPEKSITEFKNFKYKEKVPFIIYADCECLIIPKNNSSNSSNSINNSNTIVINKHEIFSIGFYLKCSYDDSLSKYYSYQGPASALWFATQLKYIAAQVDEVYQNVKPMEKLSPQQEQAYTLARLCHICEKALDENEVKVRDHCHLTGKYRGAAHESCNLNYQDSKVIPVVFHNLSGYDAHFIIADIANSFPGSIQLLPLTKEKYISFTKYVAETEIKLRFIDSFRFMASSLQKLSSYLNEYKIVNSEFKGVGEEEICLLTRKGVLPYEYLDCWSRLAETQLPAKSKFKSMLTNSEITDDDYLHAQKVWDSFKIQTLGEYSDLYMKTDVLLLADVFENFRENCLTAYGLDPAHYYTTPSYTWDAMLKYTGIKLQLLTDIDMVLFIERGIRGGLSQCSNRYSAANHKYMGDKYDRNGETNFLMYYDANNLYGWAMTQPLPCTNFRWIDNCENFDFHVTDDAPTGYILEVDLDYPASLHDQHNDLPFCSEHRKMSRLGEKKLIASFYPKRNYVMHYRALKQALANGLQLRKIHKILAFEQSAWMKSYIELNSALRARAQNEFEKNLYKLMNNAVFGKTMENVRKRVDVRLVTRWDGRYGAEALISKANFHSRAVFNENLVAIEMRKLRILFNKPIYIGLTVLDVSKILIYEFHYGYMLPLYKNECKLLYTDTDSLIYSIKCEDVYEDMKRNIAYFDTSDYSATNVYNMPRMNKKIPGLMKDECNGKILLEFVGLRSKMYSIRVDDPKKSCIKKIKGIKASVVQSSITFDDYVKCLNNYVTQSRDQYTIRSRLHHVETIKQNKCALSPYDDKRFLLKNSTDTLAWGHHSIGNNE